LAGDPVGSAAVFTQGATAEMSPGLGEAVVGRPGGLRHLRTTRFEQGRKRGSTVSVFGRHDLGLGRSTIRREQLEGLTGDDAEPESAPGPLVPAVLADLSQMAILGDGFNSNG
jgi:hypothetical protein